MIDRMRYSEEYDPEPDNDRPTRAEAVAEAAADRREAEPPLGDDDDRYRSIFLGLLDMQRETLVLLGAHDRLVNLTERGALARQAREAANLLNLYADTLEMLSGDKNP